MTPETNRVVGVDSVFNGVHYLHEPTNTIHQVLIAPMFFNGAAMDPIIRTALPLIGGLIDYLAIQLNVGGEPGPLDGDLVEATLPVPFIPVFELFKCGEGFGKAKFFKVLQHGMLPCLGGAPLLAVVSTQHDYRLGLYITDISECEKGTQIKFSMQSVECVPIENLRRQTYSPIGIRPEDFPELGDCAHTFDFTKAPVGTRISIKSGRPAEMGTVRIMMACNYGVELIHGVFDITKLPSWLQMALYSGERVGLIAIPTTSGVLFTAANVSETFVVDHLRLHGFRS